MDKLKAMKAGKRQYKVNWSLPDVTPQDSGKVLYVQEGGQLTYVYPQDISGDDIDVGVTSIAGQEGDFTLGNGLSIDENNEITAITTAIAGHTGNITLGYGLQISEQGELSTKPRVESLGGQTGVITLGSGLSIDDHKILNTTGTKVSTIDNHYGPITLGSGLSINDNNVLNTTGTKVSSFGGKTGDITFQAITLDNQSEFIVNNNNQFVRNVHLFQHNITISASSKDCTVTFSLILTVGVPLNTAEALLTLNAFIPNYTIFANGIYKVATANHQQVLSLHTKNANDTAFDLTMVNSTGTVNKYTLNQSEMTAVADSVIVII